MTKIIEIHCLRLPNGVINREKCPFYQYGIMKEILDYFLEILGIKKNRGIFFIFEMDKMDRLSILKPVNKYNAYADFAKKKRKQTNDTLYLSRQKYVFNIPKNIAFNSFMKEFDDNDFYK